MIVIAFTGNMVHTLSNYALNNLIFIYFKNIVKLLINRNEHMQSTFSFFF